ncbi:MAG TPA: hypothetical protein VJ917_01605 [Saprospiraceae bacterium]|nr:hypothetical protein [Saprospiraceae bacterium]
MRTALWLSLMTLLGCAELEGQTAEDALFLYRPGGSYGTTRAMSTMDAINALGADLNVINSNPAGLGNFRRSEFVFSSSLEVFGSTANLGNEELGSEANTKYQVDNLGLVFAGVPKDRRSNWKQFNFGLSYQRQQSYQTKLGFEAETPGSLTESFLERAFGRLEEELNPFYEGLAYGTALIIDDNNPGNYFIDFPEGASSGKFDLYETEGSRMNFSLSFGANYDDKLLLGATLSLPSYSRTLTRTYNEFDDGNQVPVFDGLEFFQEQQLEGGGINGKFGLIYNVHRALRIGLSTETPTSMSITEPRFIADFSYSFTENGFSESLETMSPEGNFEYRLITPWRHSMSIGSIIGRKGFIAARLDYRDYTQMRYDFGDDRIDRQQADAQNSSIDTLFSSSLNLSIGGELALDDFRVRLGYGFEQSPYADRLSNTSRYSLGAGWRGRDFFIDLGYLLEANNRVYQAYSSVNFPETRVTMDQRRHRISLTLGFKL